MAPSRAPRWHRWLAWLLVWVMLATPLGAALSPVLAQEPVLDGTPTALPSDPTPLPTTTPPADLPTPVVEPTPTPPVEPPPPDLPPPVFIEPTPIPDPEPLSLAEQLFPETAELGVSLSASAAEVQPGTVLTYTLVLGNVLTQPLAALVVSDTLPVGLSYVADSATGFTYDAALDQLRWEVPPLPPGEVVTGTFRAQVDATLGDAILNQAEVTSFELVASRAAWAVVSIGALPPNQSWITPDGGGVAVPATALSLTFPTDAVAEPVRVQLDDTAPEAPPSAMLDEPTAEGTLNGPVLDAWELTATLVDETEVTTFTQPLTLTVQLGPYLDALTQQEGSPSLLWLNETTGAWEIVPSEVNWQAGIVSAAVTHFSTYGVGATDTLSYGAQYLPTVRGFNTDEWSGNSSISYPLTLPPGPAGLSLPLSLNYSSEGVNSLRQGPDTNERSGTFHTQAGFAGWGWSIGGLGSISYSVSTDEYHLTYPGGTTRLVQQGNVYQTVPQSFARIERVPSNNALWLDHWQVWTPDGTRYTFGTYHSNNGFAWNNDRNDANLECWRFMREAHLTEVMDTRGNRVTIEYAAEREAVPSGFCRPETLPDADEYVRAIYPSYLEYIPAGAGASSTVRVTFVPEGRDDWNVEHRHNDFVQAYWADKRLQQILVEVRGAAGWERVRSYHLSYDYRWLRDPPHHNNEGLLLLAYVTERGRDHGDLPAWTFGYDRSRLQPHPVELC